MASKQQSKEYPFFSMDSSFSSCGDDWWRRQGGEAHPPCSVLDAQIGSPFTTMHEGVMSCTKEHSFPSTSRTRGPQAGVPVFVMLPLDSVTSNNTVSRKRAMNASLLALKSAGVEGVMMDVWWGIVEKDGPGRYNWAAYKELINMVKKHGLKVQAVMSFHQCGGNVGDSCCVPLPNWVAEEVDRNQDLVYTDRHGRRNYEYLSLGCDTLPVLNGRSPVQVYSDYMRSFRDNFRDLLGETIVEIQVGMGPAGELRYPSYPESNGTWRFPGIGEFQCYDKYMLASLKAAAECVGKPQWGHGGPSDAAHYNNWPEESDFFRRDAVAAESIFRSTGVKISGKVAGIHWHYGTRSHAAELTAGYYNTRLRDGYKRIAQMFGRHGVVLNFTCIEMKDMEQPGEAMCSPENLIRQVMLAARYAEVPVAGENALPRFDESAHRQVIQNSRLSLHDDPHGVHHEPMCAFTFLRMSEALFQSDNWRNFVAFVRQMAEGHSSVNEWQEKHRASESFVHATGPLIQEAAAALAHH
ncbi:hypothetical protein GOP47_0023431 [Adiantum capillus-veneris]|uniref:Beta-amylase n=1 Tax=Adiantum capillus-veneris TaxID=13818 RepID=A0A9D4Z5W7_ADICA|nr:hypothetical protein GOP47_0023431 [Adiantum capillus-veneris]